MFKGFLDALSRIECMKEQAGEGAISETRYEYTPSGKIKKIITPERNTILREYDAIGNMTEETGTFGSTRHRYDKCQRETEVTQPEGSGYQIRYNPDGKEAELLAAAKENTLTDHMEKS